MPTVAALRTTPEHLLLRDYWARRFEGEVARAWQSLCDDNPDQGRIGSAALVDLIGETALAEARDVLIRDGIPGAAEGMPALCRAFVARTVRLRYFAPGTRGCHFPAVRDWRAIDDWLEESGLDLPPPISGARLPLLLERSRPSGPSAAPAFLAPLPPQLPYGRSDPDRLPAPPAALPESTAAGEEPASAAPSPIESLCLGALERAAILRRRPGALRRLGELSLAVLRPPLRVLLRTWERRPRPHATRVWELRARLHLLRTDFAASLRAERHGRYAAALRHLRRAQDQYERLRPCHGAQTPAVRQLERQRRDAAEALAHTLAVAGRLSAAEASGLPQQIRRLAAAAGPERSVAASVLRHLERALLSGEATYYRIELRAWLATGRARQILPFQGILKELRALDSARRRLEELSWPVAELDRLARPIAAATERLGKRLARQIAPRVLSALSQAGFAAAAPAQRIARRRLTDSLIQIVLTRWQLRFADVRDLLARDALRLPDASLDDLLRGDLLGRFDRAAALALPGVYQRGEPYVKGLQRLGAPFFGTGPGRLVLRLVLGPWLAAYAGLVSAGLLWGLVAPAPHPHWTDPTLVLPLAAALSLTAGTRPGRRFAIGLWRGTRQTWDFLLGQGLTRVLRRWRYRVRYWGPTAWVLERPLVRGLIDRLLAPLTVGLIPLLPALIPLWMLTPDELEGALWIEVPAVAFALGILLRDTPGGRRWLDDLIAGWQRVWTRLRHEGLADLAAAVMGFFTAQTRRLAEGLYRVRGLLDRRLGEPWSVALLKSLAAPVWGAVEALIQFYAVVLIEPQTNPIKHFPVVTVGHKLMLPFLPAITLGMNAVLSPFLPAAIAIPLVALNVFLIPGLFGFLFWELKENWKLYAANRRVAVPPARIGAHGDTVRALLRRGFHGGTLPKAFDRLRLVLERQVRDGHPDPRGLRRATRELANLGSALQRFAEQDLALPLKEGCEGERSGLREIRIAPPRLATQAVELDARLQPQSDAAPIALSIRLVMEEAGLRCEARLQGPMNALPERCRKRLEETLTWFARRCGARATELSVG